MSTDSRQWQALTPGFIFIVTIGDHIHVLKPVDQKSSDNLNLAQQAEANISLARSLFDQHQGFLLEDRVAKIEEVIKSTQEAISRVTKLLEPSRVTFVSDESIRVNTKNPWLLADDHKAAATFGLLYMTHNKLKTVLHDLTNIETTTQLDSCEVRANPTIPSTESSALTSARGDLSGPFNANILPVWKHAQRSKSVGGHASFGHRMPSLAAFSRTTASLTNATGSVPRVPATRRAENAGVSGGGVTETSEALLPAIPELEAVLLGSPPSSPAASRKRASLEHREEANQDEIPGQGAISLSRANTRSTNTSSGVSSLDSPTGKRKNVGHHKTISFTDYRRKVQEQRQNERDVDQGRDQDVTLNQLYEKENNLQAQHELIPRPLFGAPEQSSGLFHIDISSDLSFLAVCDKPDLSDITHDTQKASGTHATASRSQTEPVVSTLASAFDLDRPSAEHRPASISGSTPLATEHLGQITDHTPRTVVPPRLVPASEIHLKNCSSSDRNKTSEGDTDQIQTASPHHMQQISSNEQSISQSTSSEMIDTRRGLPSALRTTKPHWLEQKAPLPYPISEPGSDYGDQSQSLDAPELNHVQGAARTSMGGFQKPPPRERRTYPTPKAPEVAPASSHNRSISSQSIPEISVTRVNTISRKPLPSAGTSTADTSRPSSTKPLQINMPQIAESENESGHGTKGLQNYNSPLPSPAVSELAGSETAQVKNGQHQNPYLNQLHTTTPGGSRRSSMSNDKSSGPNTASTDRSTTNPLSLKLTSVITPASQQNLSLVNGGNEMRTYWQSHPLDYSSPAFQQTRHFHPSGLPQLVSATALTSPEASSYFQGQPTQPRQPTRTQTHPAPPVQGAPPVPTTDQARRASGPGYIPPHMNARDTSIPPHPTVPAPPPPRHPEHNISGLGRPSPPLTNGNIAAVATPADSRKPVKDRELFGRQIFRSNDEAAPVRQPPPVTQPNPVGRPVSTTINSFNQNASTSAYLNRQISAEIPLAATPQNFQQYNQWQYSTQLNETPNMSTNPMGQTTTTTGPAPATATKARRQSWLAHHASKLSSKQSRTFGSSSLDTTQDWP